MPQFTKRLRNLVRAAACRLSPSLADDVRLAQYVKKWVLPRDTGTNEYFVSAHMLGHAGFDLHVDDQLARISRWTDTRYQELFRKLRDDPHINTGWNGQSFGTTALHNGYYPTPDAEIYAAMILDIRPKQVIEVGSGFSTLIARHAIRFGNIGSKLTVIDPEPRTNVSAAADEVIRAYVEDTDLANRTWDPSTILFIDSSHICRSRGDVPLFFCRVLPTLPAGMVVHVHDIFIPYEYPTNYDELCYTEQHLLHCLLSGSPRYRTLLSTQNLSRNHSSPMQHVFGEKVGRDPLFSGASYWIEVTDQ